MSISYEINTCDTNKSNSEVHRLLNWSIVIYVLFICNKSIKSVIKKDNLFLFSIIFSISIEISSFCNWLIILLICFIYRSEISICVYGWIEDIFNCIS